MGKKKKKDSSSDELVINTEQDWENLKNQPGIIVLDVYTKWAGPCNVMKPVFNKIKNAVSKNNNQKTFFSFLFMQMIQAGDPDILTYTAVCSDSIPTLEPFKSNCMPVFLLVAAGNIVAFVHGADGKKMKEVMH